MATAKGKRPQTAGKKGAPQRNGGKKGAASTRRKPARRREPVVSTTATGLTVLAIGAFLLFSLLSNSNALALVYTRRLVNLLCGTLGWLSVMLVCWLGMQWAFGERWPIQRALLPLASLLVFCLLTLLQVFEAPTVLRELSSIGESGYVKFVELSGTRSNEVAKGGGAIGALLAYPLEGGLDIVGSVLVLFFAMGACAWGIIRMLFPSAGESVGGWWDQIREDFSLRREERQADKAALLRERQDALLVPLPEELLQGDPMDDDLPKPKIAKGRKLATSEPEAKLPPKGTKAPERPVKAAPARQEAANAAQRKLFIEDVLPQQGGTAPADDAYTEYDVERTKYENRPRRKQPDTAPDYITKRRDGTRPFAPWEPEDAPAQAYEAEEVRYNAPPAPAAEYADSEPWDDLQEETALPEPEPTESLPWEPVEPMYAPKEEAPAPVRRRDRYANPLDRTPEIPPEERLDRPDWKPAPPPVVEAVVSDGPEYRQPPISLLARGDTSGAGDTRDEDMQNSRKLEEALASFGVEAHVIKVVHGPSITRYELQPAMGVKVSKIVNLTDDIALTMAAMSVRIEAPIPGKAAIGIEIANQERQIVYLRDVLEGDEALHHASRLAVALGKDITGKRIIADLAQMPHLLIAGQTGAGKSMCINSLLTSLIYRATPEEVRLILVDPKKVELPHYNGIPHLLVPVVTDAKKASGALHWAVMEMDERYKLFADVGVNHISKYNAIRPEGAPQMPQIVIVIDELADLMLVAPGEVEDSIIRIAQLARACGIYLVIATQRPSANVITGLIKANVPSRIAFRVASQIDSRIILDANGAEKLLGKGDMLFAQTGANRMVRVQGCFVSDTEVKEVTDYIKARHQTEYKQEIIEALDTPEEDGGGTDEDLNDAGGDALFQQAVEMAVEAGQISISMLQRRLRVGYARAGRLIDDMAKRNLIGQAEGSKPREVLITPEDVRLLFKK